MAINDLYLGIFSKVSVPAFQRSTSCVVDEKTIQQAWNAENNVSVPAFQRKEVMRWHEA
jgi:hypothetical protein